MVLGVTPVLTLLRNFMEVAGFCILFLTLDKPRLSWKKTCLFYTSFILFHTVFGSVWCLLHAESYARLCTMTFYVQAFVFLIWMSGDAVFQVIYNISLQVFVLLFQVYLCVRCAQAFFGGSAWADIEMRLVFLVFSIWINLRFFRSVYREIADTIRDSWKGICFISLAGNLLVIYYGVYPLHIMMRSVKEQIVFVGICILLSFTQIIMLNMLHSLKKEITAYRELELSIRTNKLLKTELFIMQESVEEIRRLHHDTRHHNLMIAEYARNDEQKELRQYLKEYMEETKRCRPRWLRGNSMINSVLAVYDKKARKKGIDIKITVSARQLTGIGDTDITVILGNLLENAIDCACESGKEERKIEVSVLQEEEAVTIVVAHTYGEHMEIIDGQPSLTGEKKSNMDMVLKSIAHYEGDARFQEQAGMLACRIRMKTQQGSTVA